MATTPQPKKPKKLPASGKLGGNSELKIIKKPAETIAKSDLEVEIVGEDEFQVGRKSKWMEVDDDATSRPLSLVTMPCPEQTKASTSYKELSRDQEEEAERGKGGRTML